MFVASGLREDLLMVRPDFSLAALYAALDDQRKARGLTWEQAVREINAPFDRLPSRPISRSRITSLRTKAVAEGDGVLQMLRWLDRSAESFVGNATDEPRWPELNANEVLRFDTRRLYAALDARRLERRLTWGDVAAQIDGVTPKSLTYLKRGGRTGFPHVMRVVGWLGVPLASFTRAAKW